MSPWVIPQADGNVAVSVRRQCAMLFFCHGSGL